MSSNGEELDTAWRRFVETREIASIGLRDEVRRAWARGPARSISPDQLTILPAQEVAARLRNGLELIDSAGVYLGALSLACGVAPHAVAIADRDAIVLDVVGDPKTIAECEVPGPGCVLSEHAAGANAIGTAIAERKDCQLTGHEQFLTCLHPFRSEGAVILDPDREVAGAVSLSIDLGASISHAHDVLVCAARGIEAELVRRRLQKDIKNLLAAGDDVEPLERLRQDVVQLHAAARLGVERAARATGRGEDAMALLSSANELLERFRERAGFWRALASNERSAPHPFALEWKIAHIIDLLATDLAMRGVSISIEPTTAVMILADGRLVFREIFSSLRAALALAKRGDRLRIGFDPMHLTAIIDTPSGAAVRVPLSIVSLVETIRTPAEPRGIHA